MGNFLVTKRRAQLGGSRDSVKFGRWNHRSARTYCLHLQGNMRRLKSAGCSETLKPIYRTIRRQIDSNMPYINYQLLCTDYYLIIKY